jgi:hypothetical protein
MMAGDDYILNADEFTVKVGFSILKKHFNDLLEIPAQFIKRLGLRVRP